MCALAAAVAFAAVGAHACTTFVVGRNASATGRVIVGHNEDDKGELSIRHGYVPARDWGEGEYLPCETGRASIPQVTHTLGFFWSEVKSPCGGISNADTMYNEKGVLVLSNSAGGCVDPGEGAHTDGGVEYNVRRIVAERAVSARDAVVIVTNLVTKWGYAPRTGRLYTVADKDEAFVIELLCGRSFAVRRCPDDHVTIIPNCYTIRRFETGDIISGALAGRPSDFDFAKTFQTPEIFKRPIDTERQMTACRFLTGRDWPDDDYPFSVKPSKRMDVALLKDLLLRSYRPYTVEQSIWQFAEKASGMVAEISPHHDAGPKHVRFSPLGDLPAAMDDGDAPGRLDRHLLPEPASGGCDMGLFLDLLRIPSATDDIAACNRATDVLKAWLVQRGVHCTELVTPTGGRRFLYAATTPGKVHDCLFVTHIDVVPADARQFAPKIVGERVYARGACDTKGNAVVVAGVLARLASTGVSVAAVFSTNEECAGGTEVAVEHSIKCGYLPRRLVIVGDTTGDNNGLLAVGEKGHVVYRMRARGKGGHSSVPWLCDNPVPKLMDAYAKVRAAFPLEATAESPMPDTLTATILSSDASVGGVVPDTAELALSYRYLDPQGREKMAARLRELTGLEIEVPRGVPPVRNRPDDPEIESLFAAMREKLGPGIHKGVFTAATDAARYVGMGVPIVIFTADSHGAHAMDEWGSAESMHAYTDFFAEYLASRQ